MNLIERSHHFYLIFLVGIQPIIRKYVSADPLKASMVDCNKLYVNVYSASPEDEGAVICCTDHLDHWYNIFSYEGFLCNSKVRGECAEKFLELFL